jgi:UDPglucose 6-dehydrogenase
MNPDRIVIGIESERAEKIMRQLYESFDAPIVVTDIQSAELIKHASNCFLAMKISYINAIADICERTGADVVKVAEGMGLDSRIGRAFLNAGVGFGGFCFPKDLSAFIKIAEEVGYDFELLKAVEKINLSRCQVLLKKIRGILWILEGKTIGVLGLLFKPNTDDIREAPSLKLINELEREGAQIKSYDPAAMKKAKACLNGVVYCNDPYEVAEGSDALIIMTEWEEFKRLDFERIKSLLRRPVIIDGRNIYDPKTLKDLGFTYIGIGRR